MGEKQFSYLSDTKIYISTTYHPQSDGHMEIVNKALQ